MGVRRGGLSTRQMSSRGEGGMEMEMEMEMGKTRHSRMLGRDERCPFSQLANDI